MKHKLLALPRRYLTALQRYLKAGAGARRPPAHRLGEEVVALDLETLDLARIHEIALATLIRPGYSSSVRSRMTKQAEIFFAEANSAIEKTHVAAVEAKARSQQLNAALVRRTEDLAASRRGLKRGIVHRKAAEEDFKKRAQHSVQLLKQSRLLQKHLRQLARQIFATQEDERKRMSRELHDEIAQTLLGINVRLITLQRDAMSNTADLHKDIAGTQRLVEKSVKTMRKLAQEFTKTSLARWRIGKPVKKSVVIL